MGEAADLFDEGGIGGLPVPPCAPPAQQARFLFKHAMVIPGPLHILHNGMKSVAKDLKHYPLFEGQLKVMVDFVSSQTLELFVEKCIEHGPFSSARGMFARSSAHHPSLSLAPLLLCSVADWPALATHRKNRDDGAPPCFSPLSRMFREQCVYASDAPLLKVRYVLKSAIQGGPTAGVGLHSQSTARKPANLDYACCHQ
jgi:hypothetical protein